MAKAAPKAPLTPRPHRIERIVRLIRLVCRKGHTRSELAQQLGVSERALFRDIALLRSLGVTLKPTHHLYRLRADANEIIGKLPFPAPQLTLAEAEQLAQGGTEAHEKIRKRLSEVLRGRGRRRRT